MNLGPLWSISCYVFEGWNGDLTNYFHGTQNIPNQILASVSLRQKIPLVQKNVVPGSPADVLFSKLANRHKTKFKQNIGKCIMFVLVDIHILKTVTQTFGQYLKKSMASHVQFQHTDFCEYLSMVQFIIPVCIAGQGNAIVLQFVIIVSTQMPLNLE